MSACSGSPAAVRARAVGAALALLMSSALLTIPAATPCARAQANAPDADGGTCVLLFLAGAGNAAGVADLADLRALAEQELAGALARSGAAPLSADVSSALQRRARIRDGRRLPPAFLAALDSAGADRVLLVQLIAGRDHLELEGRTIAVGSGLVGAAADAACGLADAEWRQGFAVACRRLVAALATPAPAPAYARDGAPLAALAVHAAGFDVATAQTATHSLVAAALADTTRAVLDPAVLGGALVASGIDPRRLDRPGLALLASGYGVPEVAVVEMITRDPNLVTALSGGDEDEPPAIPMEFMAAFSLHLRTVDAATGMVRAAVNVDQDRDPVRGWFGVVNPRSPRQLMTEAMHKLWEAALQPRKVR